jgi:nitrite reductase/ring-hydroxylating ferredoxin subunit
MVQEEEKLAGPDLTQGIALDELPNGGMLVGHAGDEQILLVRRGSEVFAVGAQCTHYQGPLAEGLLVGDTVRCPWHHACFDLRTAEALRAPALSPIACWNVEQRDGKIAVREKRKRPVPRSRGKAVSDPEKIVIIGGGAAGFAAAEMLRRQGYQNSIIMLSSDNALPYDRPNLSKDYLAGTIPFDYVPLRDDRFYADNSIDTRMGQAAVQVDIRDREVVVAGGRKISYDRLLLATGAEPVRLTIPGVDQPHVHTLRSLADCQARLSAPRRHAGSLSSGQALLGSRSLPPYARASWRSTSWRPINGRWNGSSARIWVTSSVASMRSTA